MSDKGQKLVGDPSLENIDPSEIVSVGQHRPPQGPNGEPIVNSNGITPPDPLLDNLGQQQTQGGPTGQPSADPVTPPSNGQPPANEPPTGTPDTPSFTTPVGQPDPAQQTDPQGQQQDPNGQQQQGNSDPGQQAQRNPWDEVFNSLKSEVGVEFKDKDQFVNDLKQFNQYKQDPYSFLPPEIKSHADFIAAGGNTQEFYRLKSIDFKALPDKEVLFQSYLRDNPEHAQDPEFARMYFDKQFNQQYNILAGPKKTPADFENEDGEPDPMAYQEYERERTFAEKSLQFDSKNKREKLVSWQEQSTTPAQAPGTGMTQQEIDDYRNQYNTAVDQVKSSFKGVEVPVSENPDENLKFGLNDQIKPQWEKDLANPMEFFNEIGLHNDGKLDLNKLAKASFIYRIWNNLGPIATKLILESQARQTVTGRQINPSSPTPSAEPGQAQGDDELKEVADLILQKDFGGRRPV